MHPAPTFVVVLQNEDSSDTQQSSMACRECKFKNSSYNDIIFCPHCGNKSDRDARVIVQFDNDTLQTINSRIKQLDDIAASSRYAKQKSKLENELEYFLERLYPSRNLSNATPADVRKFLVFKETNGRTQLHEEHCQFRGIHGKQKCACIITMAAKSADSLVGKIRAIFRDAGRPNEWNPESATGNPASSAILKRHIKAMTIEQASNDVVRKQAVPLVFDKLGSLCRHLSYLIAVEKDDTTKFLLLRDRAYFAIICHSGDRANDLGLLTLNKLFLMPHDQGLFIQATAGKTFSLDNPKNFVIFKSTDEDICPVSHLKTYVSCASAMGVKLDTGCLFRTRDSITRQIVDKPVSSSLMSDRLKSHLKAINSFNGESAHSGRRGLSITLRMLGLQDSNINQHIGWASERMINHYANIGHLCSPTGIASTLAQAARRGQNDHQSSLEKISHELLRITDLPSFIISENI